MDKKKALLSGITGQDGSYLAELLLEKGYEVHGIIRRSSSFNTGRIDHIFNKITLHYGDLTDGASLLQIILKVRPDEIYNLGAQSHVQVSFQVPEYTADTDALGCIRFIDAIKSSGIKCKYLQASTSELYGDVLEMPQTEKTPFNPQSPYACAKLYAYYIVKNYRESYGMFLCNSIGFNHESVCGDTPVFFKDESGLIDIKPISEVVKYHTNNSVLPSINESNKQYQETEVDKQLYIWDNNDWTRVKFASGYPHDIKNNPKYPKYVMSKDSICMATNIHPIIMDSGDEKEIQNIRIGDQIKLTSYPNQIIEVNILTNEEAEMYGVIVKEGYISNDNHFYIPYINNKFYKYLKKLWDKICDYKYNNIVNSDMILKFDNHTNWINRDMFYDEYNSKRIPKIIFNSSISIQKHFIKGYKMSIFDSNKLETTSSTLASGLLFLITKISSQKYFIDMDIKNNKQHYNLCLDDSKEKDNLNKINKIIEYYDYEGWFYDLETESGTFHCGVGRGVVHNSPRRGPTFVTKKITKAVSKIVKGKLDCLYLGNLNSLRDWGHAKEYVEGMWRMLQYNKPDDYILSTGKMTSVREFCKLAFKHAGYNISFSGIGSDEVGILDDGRIVVRIDPKYYRPAEVDKLLGDSSKAKNILGWEAKIQVEEIIKEMVEYDLMEENR